MTNFNIAVIDDDNTQAEYIRSVILRWAAENAHFCEVAVFSSAESFLFAYSGDNRFDILCLDVEMPGMNGIDLAKRIREQNEHIPLLFITGYADYIAEGYDVSALHYLIKPINKDKLFSVLDKAVKHISHGEKMLSVEQSGEHLLLPLSEIRYLEVSGNYVTVHAKKEHTVKKTLGELESRLDERFARTGRSFIVNLTFVRRITKTEVILSSGETVPISRGMYESLNRAVIDRM